MDTAAQAGSRAEGDEGMTTRQAYDIATRLYWEASVRAQRRDDRSALEHFALAYRFYLFASSEKDDRFVDGIAARALPRVNECATRCGWQDEAERSWREWERRFNS
jgi:hypothetical protein